MKCVFEHTYQRLTGRIICNVFNLQTGVWLSNCRSDAPNHTISRCTLLRGGERVRRKTGCLLGQQCHNRKWLCCIGNFSWAVETRMQTQLSYHNTTGSWYSDTEAGWLASDCGSWGCFNRGTGSNSTSGQYEMCLNNSTNSRNTWL